MPIVDRLTRIVLPLVLTFGAPAIFAQTGLSSVIAKQIKIPPADEAFTTQAQPRDGALLVTIAAIPGTYFYRDKVVVIVSNPAVRLRSPTFPAGVTVDDETFGKTVVYRGAQEILVPYSGGGKTNLSITMQGCHEEAKICYPPQQFKFTVDLPQSRVAAKPAAQKEPILKEDLAKKSEISQNTGPIVVKTVAALDAAIAKAKGKYVMIDVWATWCGPCREMDRTTLSDPNVQAELAKHFVIIKADVTAIGAASNAIMKRYDLPGPPGMIFYSKNGKEIQGGRLMGYTASDKFLSHLKLVMS